MVLMDSIRVCAHIDMYIYGAKKVRTVSSEVFHRLRRPSTELSKAPHLMSLRSQSDEVVVIRVVR